MDNPETLTTLGTQVTWGRKQTKQGAIRNGQSRDSGNIGYTSHVRTKTNKSRGNQEWTIHRLWQHWVHKSREDENKQNKGQSGMDNPQTLAALGTQVTWGRKQTKQGEIRNGQSRDSGNIEHTSHVMPKTNKTQQHNTEN